MRFSFFICAIILSLNISQATAQPKEGFVINGQIEGLTEGETATLILMIEKAPGEKISSTTISKSSFAFKGIVPEGPRMYHIIFDKHPNKFIVICIDNNEQIHIKGKNIDSIPIGSIHDFIQIEGSKTDHDWSILISAIRIHLWFLDPLRQHIEKTKDSIGFNRPLLDGLEYSKTAFEYAIYRSIITNEYYNKSIPIILISESHFKHTNYLPEAYNNLTQNDKVGYYGRLLKTYSTLSVGQRFPDTILPDLEGRDQSIKSLINKSKLTVIHFWTSNSFQVDDFQKELLVYHKKYQEKGLNIIGIYSDTSARKWKIAAADLSWMTQLSDLKGSQGVVGRLYDEVGDPSMHNTTNVLVDAQGNILAWDISGVELQWYLNKYLGE
jgi:peroxiredoxin